MDSIVDVILRGYDQPKLPVLGTSQFSVAAYKQRDAAAS